MTLKKHYLVGYYRYNLTEWVEEYYFTKFIARLRGYLLHRQTDFRIYIKHI